MDIAKNLMYLPVVFLFNVLNEEEITLGKLSLEIETEEILSKNF